MNWLGAVGRLRDERRAGVLVTLAEVRGHAPRWAGAKMVVDDVQTWGTIGGGNLEASVTARARSMLQNGCLQPQSMQVELTEHAAAEHGIQCCGGVVDVLLEPLPVLPSVAIFGMGHVGWELARVLARHDLDLHLVDSRAQHVNALDLADAVARVFRQCAPVPELALGQVPTGTHVLVMTHDHAEDLAICDAALRSPHLASIGLIGSAAKWRRFQKRLLLEGHTDLHRITTPIGIPEITAKDPASVALSVAAWLAGEFARADVDRVDRFETVDRVERVDGVESAQVSSTR